MRRSSRLLLAVAVALALVAGCGHNARSLPASEAPVSAAPGTALAFGLPAPSTLLGRHTSTAPTLVLSHDGAETDPALTPSNAAVSQSAEQFSPDWSAGDKGSQGLAYALYRFNVYSFLGDDEVRLSWSASQSPDDCLLGIADFSADCWRFLPCPADGIVKLTNAQFSAAIDDSSGDLLAVPVCTGQAPWILSSIRIGPPLTILKVTPNSAKLGASVRFTAEASGSQGSDWVWDLGGAASSGPATGQAPTVVLDNCGFFLGHVTAQDERGHETRRDFALTVKDSQNNPGEFIVCPTSGESGLAVTMQCAGVNNEKAASWDFGGGASPNTAYGDPQVILGSPGTYAASVTLSTYSDTCTFHFLLNVKAFGEPLAPQLLGVQSAAYAGIPCQLVAQGSGLDDATLTWELPDPSGTVQSTGPTMTFTPTSTGQFLGSVTATSGAGSTSILFSYSVEPLPTPDLTSVEGSQMLVGVAGQLSPAGPGVLGGDSFHWDFGGACDPNESTDPYPSITPLAAGQYDCTVTCSNPAGSSTLQFQLTVATPTAPMINAVGPTQAQAGLPVTFVASSDGAEPLTWSWDFGGGCTPNTASNSYAQVTTNAPGTYNASVTVRNASGTATLPFTLLVVAHTKVDSIVLLPSQPAAGSQFLCYAADAAGSVVPGQFDFAGGATLFDFNYYLAGSAGTYQCTFTADSPYDPTPFPFTLTVVP